MNFIHADLENYAAEHSGKESALLTELNRETHLKTTMPRMLSGHLQGRVLSLLSHLVKPETILEIGTFTGYSTLCLAEGLRANGQLFTIDTNEETSLIAKKYFDRSAYSKQIHLIHADARRHIPEMKEQFDLVFIDADKENYLMYFNLVIDKMKSGGLIIADNVLWSGKVVEPVKENDKETHALMQFNDVASSDNRVEPVLLPVRDGLLVLRVK